MHRKERRKNARERKKLEEKLKKSVEKPEQTDGLKRYFGRTVWTTQVLKGLFFAFLSLAGGYALFHPHVSVEPGLLLDPVNPFSTAFVVKNESRLFAVHNVDSICWTKNVDTGNNIRIWAPGRFERVQHTIPVLEPLATSTIACPAVIGGLGRYTGTVLDAAIEMRVSYKQTAWPFIEVEDYPFSAVRDAQNSVRWIHVTKSEQIIQPPKSP